MGLIRFLFRISVLVGLIAIVVIIPYAIDHYGKKYLLPRLGPVFSQSGNEASEIKVQKIKFKFPVGIKLEDFSAKLASSDPDINKRNFLLSGNEIYLRLNLSKELFSGVGSFEIGGAGIIIHPEKNVLNDPQISQQFDVSLNGTDYVQLVIRRLEEEFSCKLKDSAGSFIGITDLMKCYKNFRASNTEPLSDVHYELLINGDKRLLSVTKINAETIDLSENDLKESASLFRENLDFAQIEFIKTHPLLAMDLFRLKRLAEDQTRNLELELITRGISIRTGFFYYLISKEYGIKAADWMISKYVNNDYSPMDKAVKISKAEKKEYTAGAQLGKLAYSKGISMRDFLSQEFIKTYLPTSDS